MSDRHPDILSTEQAETYTAKCERTLREWRSKYGVPQHYGKGRYYKPELDLAIRVAGGHPTDEDLQLIAERGASR